MKNLSILILLFLSTNLLAGGPGGGGGWKKFVAVTTQQGDYASLQDLREGFAKFKGLNVEGDTIELLDNHEIESFILENGEVVSPNILE